MSLKYFYFIKNTLLLFFQKQQVNNNKIKISKKDIKTIKKNNEMDIVLYSQLVQSKAIKNNGLKKIEERDNTIYLYSSPNLLVNKNKTLLIDKKKIGEKAKLLKENLEVKINFFEDRPLSVELPISIECKVINTDAALKGQTVSSSYKSAVINNNIKILVPPFIESGDEIIVDSRNLEYIKKIK